MTSRTRARRGRGAEPAMEAVSFEPPDEEERRRAVGPLDDLEDPVLLQALEPDGDFEPLPPPGPGDWLTHHPDERQTFQEYVSSDPSVPDERRSVLYLQPLGAFEGAVTPSLVLLQEFARAFLDLPVEVLPALEPVEHRISSRTSPGTRGRQLLTGDVLDLLGSALPDDGFGLLGVTMEDLYPGPSWNFVFGQASPRQRVGVYSFGRYDPRGDAPHLSEREAERLMLRRSCKVLAHETVHLMGVHHCVWWRCLMNGSNHLEESDARPFHLCPVDLRKLLHAVDFDVVDRYRRLRGFWQDQREDEEVAWLDRRLAKLEG